jgi:CelD/BcsL family acetyltransferase involved in cellulose biosynthesis
LEQTRLRIIDNTEMLSSIKKDWDNLIKECEENATIYLTYEWISTRWKHFNRNCTLNIVVIEKYDKIIGIFPLMRKTCSLLFLKFQTLETIGAANCNNVGLFKPENEQEVIKAFSNYIAEGILSKRQIVRLELVSEDCRFQELFLKNMDCLCDRAVYNKKYFTSAPFIPINTNWNSYFGSLSSNRRKKMREIINRSKRKYNVEYGKFTQDKLDFALERLFEIHTQRWHSSNIRSPFIYLENRYFYRDIADEFNKNGWLHFSFIKIDGEISSITFSFIFNKKFYLATTARKLEYAAPNPGHLHHYFLIKESFDRELNEVDFLRGDEPYKFHWTRHFRKYNNILVLKKSNSLYILYIRAALRIITIIQNKHSLREAAALILYSIKNKRLRKKMFVNSS